MFLFLTRQLDSFHSTPGITQEAKNVNHFTKYIKKNLEKHSLISFLSYLFLLFFAFILHTNHSFNNTLISG